MTTITKSIKVPYSTLQMYELVKNIDRYPEFVDWCKNVHISSKDGNKIHATVQGMKYGMSFATNVAYLLSPNQIEIRVNVGGPVRKMGGFWKFKPENDGTEISLEFEFEFSNAFLAWTVTPLIRMEMSKILKSLSKRAEAFY